MRMAGEYDDDIMRIRAEDYQKREDTAEMLERPFKLDTLDQV